MHRRPIRTSSRNGSLPAPLVPKIPAGLSRDRRCQLSITPGQRSDGKSGRWNRLLFRGNVGIRKSIFFFQFFSSFLSGPSRWCHLTPRHTALSIAAGRGIYSIGTPPDRRSIGRGRHRRPAVGCDPLRLDGHQTARHQHRQVDHGALPARLWRAGERVVDGAKPKQKRGAPLCRQTRIILAAPAPQASATLRQRTLRSGLPSPQRRRQTLWRRVCTRRQIKRH